MNDYRMSFGKHRGRLVSTIPLDYLRWVLENVEDLNPFLRAAIEARVTSRRPAPPPPPAASTDEMERIIRAVHRQLTLKWHPDRGGSNDAMAAVNEFAELARTQIATRHG